MSLLINIDKSDSKERGEPENVPVIPSRPSDMSNRLLYPIPASNLLYAVSPDEGPSKKKST